MAVGAILALLLTAATSPAINVLAVAVMLAALAQVHRGIEGRAILLAALAATALGLFRLACASIPTVWLAADAIGWTFGRVIGWLTGIPLEIGATFSGLDVLVLMSALYAGWLVCTAPPRRGRAWCAALAIVAGQIAYLLVLDCADKLLATIPEVAQPAMSDINHVSAWIWTNSLRSLIPWNLPLLVVIVQAVITAVMFRIAAWLPVVEIDPVEVEKRRKKEEKEDVPGAVLAADMLCRFGPVVLAVLIPLIVALGLNKSELKGKTIVAYEKGYLNWLKPEYENAERRVRHAAGVRREPGRKVCQVDRTVPA